MTRFTTAPPDTTDPIAALWPGKLFISMQEYADAFGLAYETVRTRVRTGAIPARQDGHRLLIPIAYVRREYAAVLS